MLFLPIVLTALHAAAPAVDQTLPIDQPMATGQELQTESLAMTATPATLQDEEEEKVLDQWTGNFTAGLTFTDGNTDRKTASATVDMVKDYSNNDRATVGLYWNYAEEGGIRTQRRTGARGQFDSAIDENTYWYVNGGISADERAGLDLRYNAGVGLGHIFRDDEEWRFSAEAGLSYVNEEFDTGVDNDYVAARLAYRANWHYSERLEIGQFTEIFPSLDESDDISGTMDTRAIYQMTEDMIAQFQWVWDWDNTPAAGRDRSDNLFLVTVGWLF